MNHRNQSVKSHDFSMVPRNDIPRSQFQIQHAHKTTFDASYLVPIYVDEVLPGDSMSLSATIFARLATPIAPVMDNLHLDTFWFFVPTRLLWDNWQKFMGEQINPGDSISYLVPQIVSPVAGYPALTVYDYMGLPTVGQVTAGQTVSHSAFWLRAYNQIYNQWFRDENLQNSTTVNRGDGPDASTDYVLKKRGKRYDYFTGCLPWPQKGAAVNLPLGTQAPVKGIGTLNQVFGVAGATAWETNATAATTYPFAKVVDNTGVNNTTYIKGTAATGGTPGIYADLTQATAATINDIRLAFAIQKLLEKNARGGTRYVEILKNQWGVTPDDARLQRPEYLGGGSTLININPIAQTAPTGATGTTTPQGNLAAMGTSLMQGNGFSQSFTEHGVILGLVSVRADLTYQQGIRRMWSRSTLYDYYTPTLAHLGEQGVLNKEIYVTGTAAQDNAVFGYQERWAEYRYHPSQITGLYRSTTAGTLDLWHYGQKFATLPTLNNTFIEDSATAVVTRSTAVSAAANGTQLLADMFFNLKTARLMPKYSVPGQIDRF